MKLKLGDKVECLVDKRFSGIVINIIPNNFCVSSPMLEEINYGHGGNVEGFDRPMVPPYGEYSCWWFSDKEISDFKILNEQLEFDF